MNASSPRASRQTPKEKKGPYTLPCGCNALGVCCPQEKALGGALDQARAAWLESGTQPGNARFPLFYRPLLDARLDYHATLGSGISRTETDFGAIIATVSIIWQRENHESKHSKN